MSQEKTIVRENLMTQKGYSPYCGADDCDHSNPRTVYSRQIHQFRCICGWVSQFPKDFIERYEQKWYNTVKESVATEADSSNADSTKKLNTK